jgi:transcription elongation factor Elf1
MNRMVNWLKVRLRGEPNQNMNSHGIPNMEKPSNKGKAPVKMGKNAQFIFNGFDIRYNCPLCGKPKSPPDIPGQSILWIALECIKHGIALPECYSCGKSFTIPAEIFSDGVLAEFNRVSKLPGDQLWRYVKENYVEKGIQSNFLKPDWFDLMVKANLKGDVDTMNMPWRAGERCPVCHHESNSHAISITYACPFCGVNNTVAQENIDSNLGARVSCRACFRSLHIPPRVWCPKCKRALVDYYKILRNIAEENHVDYDRLLVH